MLGTVAHFLITIDAPTTVYHVYLHARTTQHKKVGLQIPTNNHQEPISQCPCIKIHSILAGHLHKSYIHNMFEEGT